MHDSAHMSVFKHLFLETDKRFFDSGCAVHIHQSGGLVSQWFKTYRSGLAGHCILTRIFLSPAETVLHNVWLLLRGAPMLPNKKHKNFDF